MEPEELRELLQQALNEYGVAYIKGERIAGAAVLRSDVRKMIDEVFNGLVRTNG